MPGPVVSRILETAYIRKLLAQQPWRGEVGEGMPQCHGELQYDKEMTHYHCVLCGRIGTWGNHPHPATPEFVRVTNSSTEK